MSFARISLKSTTKISLNDRFTVLRKENPTVQTDENNHILEERRQNIQASRRNQRLAAQMERRPAVLAALKSPKNVHNRLHLNQTISVKQRLAIPGRSMIAENARSIRGTRFSRGRGLGRGISRSINSVNGGESRSFRGRGRFRGGRGQIVSHQSRSDFSRGGRGRGRVRGARRGRGNTTFIRHSV